VLNIITAVEMEFDANENDLENCPTLDSCCRATMSSVGPGVVNGLMLMNFHSNIYLKATNLTDDQNSKINPFEIRNTVE